VDEQEWLTGAEPLRMPAFLVKRASDRKLRLFVAACARRGAQFLPGVDWHFVEITERFADDPVRMLRRMPGLVLPSALGDAGVAISSLSRNSILGGDIFLCLFGNPFRPVSFDPTWRTPDVLRLASGIYEERAFDRLPYLADALEEAGCSEEAILQHCRQGGEHWRGCWVVDRLTGRK
jgi:hypothetical protein